MHQDATFHSLEGWHKYLFEKLGWMILAKKYNYNIQLQAYKNSLDELIIHLNSKSKTIKDKDKKDDLKILLSNAKILKTYVDKL
jgi:hypothetical protein